MKQLQGDIAIIEGNNELNVQMIPITAILAGEIIEIMWRVYGTAAWRSLSEAMPINTYMEHRFKIKNTGNVLTTFDIASYIPAGEYGGPAFRFCRKLVTIPPGEEGYSIPAFESGKTGTFYHTWYLFAVAGETADTSYLLWRDATQVHSKTVLVTCY